MVLVVDTLGNRTTTAYDFRNSPTSITDPLGQRTTFIYDAAGQRTATVDALGNRTTAVHDLANRMTASVDPLGSRTTDLAPQSGSMSRLVVGRSRGCGQAGRVSESEARQGGGITSKLRERKCTWRRTRRSRRYDRGSQQLSLGVTGGVPTRVGCGRMRRSDPTGRDRGRMDRARVQALDLLVELGKL